MAGFKVAFLFIFAFLLAAQVESKAIKDDINIIDTIKTIVSVLESLVDTALDEVESIVDQVNKDYAGVQKKIVNVTKSVTKSALDEFNRIITDLASQSNDDGKKLIGCIAGSETSVVDIAGNVVKSVTTCAKDDLANLVSDITPLVKDARQTVNSVKTIAKDLDNCSGNDISTIMCVVQVGGDVVTEILKHVPEFNADFKPISFDLPTVRDTVAKCWKKTVTDELEETGKVINAIAACMQ